MIIGMGSDLIDIRRVEKTLERFGERFIKRCFTDAEIAKAERRRGGGTHTNTYAKRFAAKEACSKALGTGFSNGVYLRDIGVVNDKLGRPTLHLTNGAQRRLESMLPDGYKPVIHLTLTDEPPIASAHVIIEALKP
ncbi:MAG: holo-ACP synthase [Pseudomonadota bacterium]